MKTLFDDTRLNNIKLKNRIIRSATWEGMADSRGHLTDRLLHVYKSLANGGVGLIITGATFVSADFLNSSACASGYMSIHDDSFIQDYRRLTDTVHKASCPIILQLAYVGKGGEKQPPSSFSIKDIQQIVQEFGQSAFRAKRAGFDGVQIHAAHGFFLSQFIHPTKNTRQDEYGGSLGNRTRILLEIYDKIRSLTGNDFSILLKIDGTDLAATNTLLTSSHYACLQLAQRGLNAIEVSGETGVVIPSTSQSYPESVFRDYAAKIAEKVQIPIILVGLNRTPTVMETLLNTSNITYFSLSRPLIRESDLVNQWLENPTKAPACISCNQCFHSNGNTCIFVSPQNNEATG